MPAVVVLLMTLVPNVPADVPPPHINQFQANPDGSVLMSWDASPGSAYLVLTSTNLGDGSWVPVDYIVALSNTATWQATAQSGAARFYKLATDSIAIQSVEPALSSLSTSVDLYIIGQGFGSNDVLRLIGPGGPLVLTNRVIVSSTLMRVTLGPGFIPDVPGTYGFDVTSGSTGRKATLTYAWTLVSGTTASQALVGPPQEPPASPTMKWSSNMTPGSHHLLADKRGYVAGKYGIELEGILDRGEDCDDGEPDASARPKESLEFNYGRVTVKRSKSNVSNNRASPISVTVPTGSCGPDLMVESFSGEVQLQEADLVIPGRGLDFILARTYRSSSAARPGMTYSWTLSYDVSVSQTPDGIAVFDGTGRSDVYFPGTNGVYSRNEFFNEGRLRNGVFTLTFPDTGRWEFNPLDASASAGKLSRSVDRNGNFMSFAYDTSGRLLQIVDDLGRTNTVSYNSTGLPESVTDFSGRVVRYEYDTHGDLAACVSPAVTGTPNGNDFPGGKTNRYTYTSGFSDDRLNHKLASCADGKGQTVFQASYQKTNNPASIDFGAVDFVKRGPDREFLRRYPQTPSPANGYATVKAIVCDGVGNVSESYYNSRGNCARLDEWTGRSNPNLPVTETSNRPIGPLRPDDPALYETQWSWNNDSLCVKEIEPGGNVAQCVYQLDLDKNASPRKKGDVRVCREIPCCADLDRDGFPDLVTRLDYDPRFGSPALAGSARYGRVKVQFHWDREGRQDAGPTASGPSVPGGLGVSVGYSYAKRAAIMDNQRKDVAAIKTYVEQGIAGRMTGSGSGPHAPVLGVSVGYSYAKRAAIMDNQRKNVACIKTYVEQAIASQEAGLSGLAPSLPSLKTDPYNGCNFVISSTDPRGNGITANYDANGNRTVLAHQGRLLDGSDSPVANFSYNTYGQLTAVTNAADATGRRRVETFEYYDTGPQLGFVKIRDTDSTPDDGIHLRTTYEYDARGNLSRCIDPRTNDWLYTWNALDQFVQCSSAPLPGGSVGSFRIATQYAYDAADNLTECDVENRDQTGGLGTNSFWRTQYIYDSLNRLSGCWRDKNGNLVLRCTDVGYDANDNVVLYRSGEAVNGNNTNKVVQFSYDERDLLFLSIAGATGGVAATNQWDYTPNGKIKKLSVDLYVENIAFNYNGFDRCISVQDPKGNVVTNRYDANGNLVLSALLGETNDVPGSAGNRVLAQSAWQFDALDRCVSVQQSRFSADGLPLGNGLSTTTCAWAPNGECLSVTDDNNHTTRFTYDSAGRLATVTDPKTNTVSYVYDNNGNVTAFTQTDKSDLGGPNEVFVTMAQFDALNRCVSSSDNTGNTTQYAYDSRDNLVRQTDPKGTLTGWFYDGLDRCTLSITDLNGDGVLDFATDAGSAYVYDDNDCLLVSTDANTNSAFYAYDELDRCVAITNMDGTTHRFTWNPLSNLISETDANGTVISNSYDLNNNCVRRDITPGSEVAATTTFETFVWDGCARLVLASNDVSRLDYAYDSLGNCTSSKQDSLTTVRACDGVGNCLSMTYPGGRVVTYTYDALDQVTGVSSAPSGLPPSSLAQYQYEGPARLGRIVNANGINTRIFWNGKVSPPNAAGDFGWMQPQGINHQRAGGGAVVDQRFFAYDRNQNKTLRAQATEFAQGQGTLTNIWGYNPLNMVDHAIKTKGTGTTGITDYDLDALGNRRTVTSNGVAAFYTRDSTVPPADFQMDQYTFTPFGNELHDHNGNLTQINNAAGQTLYAYDYANRLVEVFDLTTGTPTPVVSFTYDVLGERTSKTSYSSATVTTYYVHCGGGGGGGGSGGTLILEARSGGPSGGVTHVFCWGENGLTKHRDAVAKGISKVAAFTGAGALEYYFHSDDLGNVLALTDGGGNVLERFEYGDYGAPTFLTSDGVETSATTSARGNPFLFHGMEWDGETGLYLWKEFSPAEDQLRNNPRHRAAYVDPKTGRSTTRYCENPVRADRCARQNAYSLAGDNPWSAGESCNVIKGCWIGLDASGRSALGNGSAGVFISRGTTSSKMSVLFNPKEYTIQKSAVFGRRHELTGHVTLMK